MIARPIIETIMTLLLAFAISSLCDSATMGMIVSTLLWLIYLGASLWWGI